MAWTVESLRVFLEHRPAWRETCDGLDCPNFPRYECFHCANKFCFDCALKHFGMPLEREYPACSDQKSYDY